MLWNGLPAFAFANAAAFATDKLWEAQTQMPAEFGAAERNKIVEPLQTRRPCRERGPHCNTQSVFAILFQ